MLKRYCDRCEIEITGNQFHILESKKFPEPSVGEKKDFPPKEICGMCFSNIKEVIYGQENKSKTRKST